LCELLYGRIAVDEVEGGFPCPAVRYPDLVSVEGLVLDWVGRGKGYDACLERFDEAGVFLASAVDPVGEAFLPVDFIEEGSGIQGCERVVKLDAGLLFGLDDLSEFGVAEVVIDFTEDYLAFRVADVDEAFRVEEMACYVGAGEAHLDEAAFIFIVLYTLFG